MGLVAFLSCDMGAMLKQSEGEDRGNVRLMRSGNHHGIGKDRRNVCLMGPGDHHGISKLPRYVSVRLGDTVGGSGAIKLKKIKCFSLVWG